MTIASGLPSPIESAQLFAISVYGDAGSACIDSGGVLLFDINETNRPYRISGTYISKL